ncbi:MAG: hypothetical protein IPG50_31185 [Myxococcales bacterium]|nr:hypothetical protein [Myxococcales bacterium]
MSADATSLYLPSNGEIWRQPLAGGAATLVHSQNDSPITSVGVVGAELFYATPPPTLPGPRRSTAAPVVLTRSYVERVTLRRGPRPRAATA